MGVPHRVFVYRSADPGALQFSIWHLESGLVTQRDEVWLVDAVFDVSPSARLRALRERRKTVHAGVFGTLIEVPPRGRRCDVAVRYRPTESPFFLNDEHRPVHEAEVCHLVGGRAFVPREARWL